MRVYSAKKISKWYEENKHWLLPKVENAPFTYSEDIRDMQIFKSFDVVSNGKIKLFKTHMKDLAITSVFGKKLKINPLAPVRTVDGFYTTYGRLPTENDYLTVVGLHTPTYKNPTIPGGDTHMFMSELRFNWLRVGGKDA